MAAAEILTDRMRSLIQDWEQAGDRRAVFLACYNLMTDNMFRAIAGGQFEDRDWVTNLVHNFADYYFVALVAYDQHDPALPEVWRQAHDQALQPTTTVAQSLLLGINAHINYDLVLVLDDMLFPVWDGFDQGRRARCYRDYCRVNGVIAATIDTVQEQVVEPYARAMDLIDKLCGPFDEWLTARLISNWRAEVWRHAIALIETPDPLQRIAMRRNMDAIAMERVRLLLAGGALGARVFGYPLRWLRRLRLV